MSNKNKNKGQSVKLDDASSDALEQMRRDHAAARLQEQHDDVGRKVEPQDPDEQKRKLLEPFVDEDWNKKFKEGLNK